MKTASATYKTLRAIDTSWYEIRVVQGNNIYGLDKLKSVSVYPSLTASSGVSIGNANSTECRITLLEQSAYWPRMAKFTVEFRICSSSGESKSEWITAGTFYTDERSEDKYGNLSIVAFDGMMKADQGWTDKIPSADLPATWPITAYHWASMIQNAELATFADLTQLDDVVPFVGLDTTTSIRDVLKSIAAVHAGNWTMTADERLKLIPFENVIEPVQGQTANYSNLERSMITFEDSPSLSPVTGVHLETESGTVAEAGNDTGYRLKTICDFSTLTGVAELCLGRINQYSYKPFTAGNAYLDPIVEIGDSVKIDGTIYQVMAIDWTFSKSPVANVSAPYDQEVDHEYTVLNPETKTYRKAISLVDQKMGDYVPWDEVSTAIEQNAESVVIAASGTYVTKVDYNEQIAEIQAQIDGSIQTWSGNVVPTLDNAPAFDWNTPAKKAEHVGDVYFVNSDAGIPEAGQYYRFENNNGVYGWQILTDSAIAEALAQAAAAMAAAESAQDTADDAEGIARVKGRIFVVQPTPPYYVGDLWFHNTDSVIKVCMTTRESGSFVSSDWVKRDNYADYNDLDSWLSQYSETIQDILDQVDQKAETYYQETDPQIEWGGSTLAGIAIAGINFVGVDSFVVAAHKGDLWYRTTDNTTWYWDGLHWIQQDVPDEVFDKIDGKAQVFVSTPYPPYAVGDLWFNGTEDDIKTCIRARSTGAYTESDWVKYNKYTDDSALEEFVEVTYQSDLEVTQRSIAAKVQKDQSGTKTSFGWVLDETAHTWYSNDQEVMKVNRSGLSVKGNITATSGFIGSDSSGFEITATAIRNGMTSLTDTTHNGVYIGTNGIALGRGAFKVTSGGAVTASNLSITGGSIKIGGTASSPNFYVSAQGDLTANSGIFKGNVYAKNIQYGSTAGHMYGGAIESGTVSGGSYGQIAQYTLDDYNVAKTAGGYGAYTTASFSAGVQGSLYNADMFGYATRRGSSQYPEYFCATSITALSTMYANDYYIELGGDRQLGLKTHYHTVIVSQDGTVQFGQPTTERPDPFNVADTKKYRDDVAAITVSSLDLEYTYDDEMHIYRLMGYAKNQAGTVVYQSTAGQWNTDRSAYVDGKADGADEVTITAITRTYPDGESSYPYYESQTLGKVIEFKAQASMSNGHGDSAILTVPATAAYNAGKTDGISEGASGVTITSITRTYPDGESSYPYYDSPTLGKVIEFKSMASMSNGHGSSTTLTVPATAAYDSGYTAGSALAQQVVASTLGFDPDESISYSSSVNNYYVPIKTVLTNGNFRRATLTVSGQEAYNQGQGNVTASATGLGTNSSNYGTYDQAIGLSSSSVYTSSGTQYGRIQVNLSNNTSRIVRVSMPSGSTVARITSASTSYDYSDYYYSGGKWWLYVHAKDSNGNTLKTDSVEVQHAVDYGASQGSNVSWVQILSSDYSLANKQVALYCYNSANQLVYSNYNVRITYDDR